MKKNYSAYEEKGEMRRPSENEKIDFTFVGGENAKLGEKPHHRKLAANKKNHSCFVMKIPLPRVMPL